MSEGGPCAVEARLWSHDVGDDAEAGEELCVELVVGLFLNTGHDVVYRLCRFFCVRNDLSGKYIEKAQKSICLAFCGCNHFCFTGCNDLFPEYL